jgi:hypothetical protein
MNVTKGIAALTLAVLAMPTQGAHGCPLIGSCISYIVSADTATNLRLTVNHPSSTFNSETNTLKPPITNWSVGGILKDNNAGLITLGNDTVAITELTVQHLVNPGPGPVFTVPPVTASGAPNNVGSITSPLITYSSSAAHGADTDYVEVTGAFKWHSTNLGGSDIDAYNFVVLGDHVKAGAAAPVAMAALLSGANESSPVSTSAFGSLSGFFHPDTSQLDLEIGMVALQSSDISDIQITSTDPGFIPLDLGTSALLDGTGGVAFGADVLLPAADLGAFAAGDAFVNVLTVNNPNGEIGGLLSVVPEPSSLFLLTAGLACFACFASVGRKSAA